MFGKGKNLTIGVFKNKIVLRRVLKAFGTTKNKDIHVSAWSNPNSKVS